MTDEYSNETRPKDFFGPNEELKNKIAGIENIESPEEKEEEVVETLTTLLEREGYFVRQENDKDKKPLSEYEQKKGVSLNKSTIPSEGYTNYLSETLHNEEKSMKEELVQSLMYTPELQNTTQETLRNWIDLLKEKGYGVYKIVRHE